MQTPSRCLVTSTCSEHLSRPWETLKVHGLWARVLFLILGCTFPHCSYGHILRLLCSALRWRSIMIGLWELRLETPLPWRLVDSLALWVTLAGG